MLAHLKSASKVPKLGGANRTKGVSCSRAEGWGRCGVRGSPPGAQLRLKTGPIEVSKLKNWEPEGKAGGSLADGVVAGLVMSLVLGKIQSSQCNISFHHNLQSLVPSKFNRGRGHHNKAYHGTLYTIIKQYLGSSAS